MTLDQVLDTWDTDSPIDRTQLGNQSLDIARLHAKWLRILCSERLRLKQREAEAKQLRLDKHEFYTQGPTRETVEKGWVFPAKGMVLNSELNLYVDADREIVEKNLQVAYQAQVVSACELIFKSIENRNWLIGRALEDIKYKMGG